MRLFVIALFAAACATSQGLQDNVRRRAAFDLSCPADKIQVVEIESPAHTGMGSLGTWGAKGCGKQATYVQDKPNSSTVILNGTARDDATAR